MKQAPYGPITSASMPTWIDADFVIEVSERGAGVDRRKVRAFQDEREEFERECQRVERLRDLVRIGGDEWFPVVVTLLCGDAPVVISDRGVDLTLRKEIA